MNSIVPADALTINEVADEVKRSPDAVRIWIHTGIRVGRTRVKLAATRIGGRILVSRESIRDFVVACNPAEVPRESAAATKRRHKAATARVLAKHFGVKGGES